MPLPVDIRKKPTDVKVYVSTGTGVDITWSDGHQSHYDFAYLRDWCPCALCDEERRKKGELTEASGPGRVSTLLPIYKPRPAARAASAVGSYAIQIEFNDGHSTGIYSFDYLRTICPCDACAREFRPKQE